MYLGLLSLSIYFCRENILDYMEGKTGYSIAKEQVGFEDILTICFCLSSQYNHGENFVASVNVYSRNKYVLCVLHRVVAVVTCGKQKRLN